MYVSADIEGLAHVVTPAQTLADGREWPAACERMTEDVDAVARAALAAGADRVVIADSHLSAENLLPDRLPRGTALVRSWPRPLGMMQGVEQAGIRGAVLLGYHTASQDGWGVLNHTLNGRMVQRLWINDHPASETLLSVLLANHYGVPVVLAVGDDAYCEGVAASYVGIDTFCTKQSLGRMSAMASTPSEVREALAEATERAVQRMFQRSNPTAAQSPLTSTAPLKARLEVKHSLTAELLAYLPQFERVDGLTVGWESTDAIALSRTLQFVTQYQPVP